MTAEQTGEEIAVIGYAGRFPGAPDVDGYWDLLREGRLGRVVPTGQDLDAAGVPDHVRGAPNFVNACYPIEGADEFDAEFFGISPGEAELTDPQHRLFLETAWQALEHAGLRPDGAGVVGVFGGAGLGTYLMNHVGPRHAPFDTVAAYRAMVGNDKDFLTTRVSYRLGLTGPGVTVQTACSTSLVAVHMACQSLLNGECDAALAGGVSVFFPQRVGYLYEPGMILSPDGYCRPFDADAAGTVQGSGVGVVLLKPLAAALAAGDTVHGVISGSAVNNDGSAKLGYTAPNGERQREAVTTAYAVAGVDAAAIEYVEAHGTGTPLGDPVEVTALSEVFRAAGAAPGSCALGSVKANIGHLDAAAGVASLVKVLLMLRHRTIVPQPNFRTPSPRLDLDNSPFYVPTEAKRLTGPAAITSTGIGGTNVHLVVTPAPERAEPSPARNRELIVVSARSAEGLDRTAERLASHLEREPRSNLSDVGYVLQQGRTHFAHRRAVVAESPAGPAGVAALLRQSRSSVADPGQPRPVFFLFPGQGAQYAGMGRETYHSEPVYRRAVDECAKEFATHLDLDLRTALFSSERDEDPLLPTELAQPALFATGYAMARLWDSWGVRPQAMIGHSLGEFVAACLSGVFTLRDAVHVVALRCRLLRDAPPGAMAAVALGESELVPRLPPGVDLAAVNAADRCVVSGPQQAVDEFLDSLTRRGVAHQRLATSRAFHSALTERAAEALRGALPGVPMAAPRIPFPANVTGDWITEAQARDPDYWASQLRRAVRFHDGVGTLLDSTVAGTAPVLVELGPPAGLAVAVRRHPRRRDGQVVVTALPPAGRGGDQALTAALGRVWEAGVDIDWTAVRGDERRHRIALPGHALSPRRHFLPAVTDREPVASGEAKLADVAGWFHQPRWRRDDVRDPGESPTRSWLLVASADGAQARLAGEVADLLRARGHDVRLTPPDADYRQLLGERNAVAHFATMGSGSGDVHEGFYDLLALARAASDGLRLRVVTDRLDRVRAGEATEPRKAPIRGLLLVLPQEQSGLDSRLIDAGRSTAQYVVGELLRESADRFVCLRDGARYLPDHRPVRLDRPAGSGPGLRDRGVYLVTGGLGKVGLTLAEHLAATARARLVLTSRTALPARRDRDRFLAEHGPEHPIGAVLARLRAIEAHGGAVLTVAADVADTEATRHAVRTAVEEFGALHGVIHAAGLTGVRALGLIEHLSAAECEEHFRAKVTGANALVAAVRDIPLDFAVLMSSTAAVFGGPGLAGYAAANCHLDALATAESGWTSVAWDFWQLGDTATRSGFAMTAGEGVEAFGRIVDAGLTGPVVVSTGPLATRLERSRHQAVAPARTKAASSPVADDDVQRTVAEVWCEALGVDEVGTEDNFFDLGGDSLIGLRVIANLQRRFGKRIPPVALYEGPTVRRLAELLRGEPEPERFTAQAERAKRRKQALLRGSRRAAGETR
jgi:acyl transferase domain-containing protein